MNCYDNIDTSNFLIAEIYSTESGHENTCIHMLVKNGVPTHVICSIIQTESALLLDTVEAVHKSLQIGALRTKQGGMDRVYCRNPGRSKSENGPRVLQQLIQVHVSACTQVYELVIKTPRERFRCHAHVSITYDLARPYFIKSTHS